MYRHRETVYHITVTRTVPEARRVTEVMVDGVAQPDGSIPLADDRGEHAVTVVLGSPKSEDGRL